MNTVFDLLFIFFSGYYSYFLSIISNKQKAIAEEQSTMDLMKKYFNEKRKRFNQTWQKDPLPTSVDNNSSENIEQQLYNPLWYSTSAQDTIDTSLRETIEKKWKSRILFENTPQGSVIMYYDVYKNGFAYYSNNILMDYFLNAIAMKYVVIFKCRDFFLDEKLSLTLSPINAIMEEALSIDKKAELKNGKSHRGIYNESENKIFAKVKADANEKNRVIKVPKASPVVKSQQSWFSYLYNFIYEFFSKRAPLSKGSSVEKSEIKPTIEPRPLYKNKFLRLGKVEDYSFLQREEKKNVNLQRLMNIPTSFDSLFDGLKPANSSLKKESESESNSYLAYKQKQAEKLAEKYQIKNPDLLFGS
jgi:hypothetical protein